MAAGEILNLLARTNLAAAAAIVAVVALRKVARPRFGARLVYGLWLLPLLAAAAVLAPARVVTIAARAGPVGDIVLPVFEGSAPVSAPVAVAATLDFRILLVALWLVGVAAAALVMTLLQRRFTAEVRKGAIGPAVVGVITPRIVTPADFAQKFSGEEQVLVLAHERAHIARQDSRLNSLAAAIQCLCWFNPLIHLAAHLMRIDQEMACDETVVTRFPDARRAYAQALVKAQLAIRPLPLGCYWPSGTEHPLLERIAMLKLNDFSRRRRAMGGSALAVLCVAASVTAWASQPPKVRFATAPAEAATVAPAAPAAPPAPPLPPATAPAVPMTEAAPAPAVAPQTVEAADPPARTLAQVAESRAQLALFAAAVKAATPPEPPPAHLIPIAAPEAQPATDGATAARPAPAVVPRPTFTDAQREALRGYNECQREAARALDDGHSSEDAIATLMEKRCETQYQTFRQAWVAGGVPGVPDERAWTLDNGRQAQSRVVVHALRGAAVRTSDIKSCVQGVADQFRSQPFDQIVDQGVLRCGALVPFPVPPVERERTMTDQQIQDRKAGQDRMRRVMIATDLRQIIQAKP